MPIATVQTPCCLVYFIIAWENKLHSLPFAFWSQTISSKSPKLCLQRTHPSPSVGCCESTIKESFNKVKKPFSWRCPFKEQGAGNASEAGDHPPDNDRHLEYVLPVPVLLHVPGQCILGVGKLSPLDHKDHVRLHFFFTLSSGQIRLIWEWYHWIQAQDRTLTVTYMF
jgi:hypothetical protein